MYFQVDWSLPSVLVVGNEAAGVRDEWKALVQQGKAIGCMIPLKNTVESLNAAVAGSMVLSEALRQTYTTASGEKDCAVQDESPNDKKERRVDMP